MGDLRGGNLMEQLWAPWRLNYVATSEKASDPDFIAVVDRQTDDRPNLVVARSELSIAILNRYPYNNGHLLVAPRRAVAELDDLTTDELLDGQQMIVSLIQSLKRVLRPDGFNVGLNLGRAAGAGLPGHLHWHIVPRWNGDTNFMTLMEDVRVIVQSLDALWVLLRRDMGHHVP